MIKCKLRSFINYHHPRSDYLIPQSHSVYELVYYSTGSGTTTINNENYNYKEDDLVLIKPNDIHDEKTYCPTEVFCVLFEMEGIEINSLFIHNKRELSYKIRDLLLLISKEFFKKDYMFEEYINNLLNQIIIIILRFIGERNEALLKYENKLKIINYSKNMIKENYHSVINFNVLADNVGYSYDRFRHLFREVVGLSPKQYQLEIRLAKSKELLLYSSSSISDIAKMCGFKSNIRFTTFFKEKMGVSPHKYRQLISDNSKKELLNLDCE